MNSYYDSKKFPANFIKTEDDSVTDGTNGQNLAKCGEIYFNHDGILTYFCTLCQINLSSEFLDHFQSFHLEQLSLIKDFVDPDQSLSLNLLEASNTFKTQQPEDFNNFLPDDDSLQQQQQQYQGTNNFEDSEFTNNELELNEPTILETESQMLDDPLEIKQDGSNQKRNFLNGDQQQRQYTCNICQKSFILKHHLTYHLTTHYKKPYYCDTCDQTFLIKHLYLTHKRSHASTTTTAATTPFPKTSTNTAEIMTEFQCCVCYKIFPNSEILMEHLNIHTNCMDPNLYSTNEIDPSIYSGDDWENNSIPLKYFDNLSKPKPKGKLRASGERPFPCTICNMRFKMKHHLKNHLETHKNYWS